MSENKQTAAKQKAVEIVEKFYQHSYNPTVFADTYKPDGYHAKQCALIAVDYQIELNNKLSHMPKTYAIWLDTDTFLRQVRSEIEKL